MEDRYEIRGKIGQGGIGSVYRGYDLRMNREVAIKRILSCPDDPSLQDEATKQLLSEAGALASLQHPHIVTVYDVGADEDGPYVVMELISGKTLDEIIENAPLTWEDFRELAMQTQEALIAAQDRDMIHSDLKPPNIMLTWLPSGKFQVKIVDFGLAVLVQNQSKEEIESLEAVFGSIFFMPPEQFERQVLDARSDLYSIGCVYYQALTGMYPFSGETGNEVMEAHLNHTVRPIHELRSDIPVWACDWIMWQINRERSDRPENARVALSVFLQNDKNPNPEMSRGAAQVKRPRLIIPGAFPSAPTPAPESIVGVPLAPPDGAPAPAGASTEAVITASQPLASPDGRPGVHTSTAPTSSVKTSPQPLASPDGRPSVHTSTAPTSSVKTSPQPLASPDGRPSVHAAAVDNRPRVATQSMATAPTSAIATQAAVPQEHAAPGVYISPVGAADASTAKGGNAMKIVIAIALGLLVMITASILVKFYKENQRNQIYNRLVTEAAAENAKEVLMNRDELQLLLTTVTSIGKVEDRDVLYQALILGKSSDGTNIDQFIADYATGREIMKDVREKLISVVLKGRANPDMVPKLMHFASVTDDDTAAAAAYVAVRNLVNDEHAEDFLKVIASTKSQSVRNAAEANLGEIVKKTGNRLYIAKRISTTYETSKDKNVRHAMIRMLGRCSTPTALEELKKALNSEDESDQIAAAVALGQWEDASSLKPLLQFLQDSKNAKVRSKVFDSVVYVASQSFALGKPEEGKALWTTICGHAKISSEHERVIRALVNIDADWTIGLIQPYTTDSNATIADFAKRGIVHIKDREKLKK